MACRRLAALLCAVCTALVAACGPSAAPTSTGSAPPAAAQPPAAGAASQGAGAAAPAVASADWDRVLAAAKQEGSPVMLGPTSEAWRKLVTEGFYNRFGISLEYLGIPTTENVAKLQREAAAGKVSFDANMSGGDHRFAPYRDLLEPVKPNLIMPGVADPQNWKDNKLKWVDPEGQYLLQTTEQMGSGITVNPDAIPPGTITSWRDLLKPEYKGKIAAFDPRLEGVGLALATYLYIQFGEDLIKPLYLQQAILTGEERQLAEWVGRRVYPIGLGVVPRQVEPLSALGLKFQRVYPEDGPGHLVGGASVLNLPKGRPHPNAGIVLVNWLAGPEGQELYSQAVKDVSRRTDVPVVAPDWLVPRPGVQYLDTYDPEFWLTVRARTAELVRQALGT